MENAAQVIEKLKTRFRVGTDTELATRLLISRSTVANWRNRDSVPERYRSIAHGQINWAAYSQPYGEMSDVERAAMRIAIMRLVRDFAEVATDYRAFMVRSPEAAMSWQSYWARACKDLHDAMSLRDSESADHCADLLAYNEAFASK